MKAEELPVRSVVMWDDGYPVPKLWAKTNDSLWPWKGLSWSASNADMDSLIAKGAVVVRVGTGT